MESKIVVLGLFITMIILLAIVSGAGCGKTNTEVEAQELESTFGELEDLDNEINNLNIDELNESELEELEELF
ncbi:MAG: hypothetical protein QXK80_01060 [Candidatus Pacearchaeota archaeon]